jgi:O-acetyl-ADP-ribose deacetylase (regulator of RNase III)
MSVIEVKGNAIEYARDLAEQEAGVVLAHQTNTVGRMGGGIALELARKFPAVERLYIKWCNDHRMDSLGKCLLIKSSSFWVANLMGQTLSPVDGMMTQYDKLESACRELDSELTGSHTIVYPKLLGCGLGGGSWGTVSHIIESTLKRHKLVCVEFAK